MGALFDHSGHSSSSLAVADLFSAACEGLFDHPADWGQESPAIEPIEVAPETVEWLTPNLRLLATGCRILGFAARGKPSLLRETP
jgi:hypothetical protein